MPNRRIANSIFFSPLVKHNVSPRSVIFRLSLSLSLSFHSFFSRRDFFRSFAIVGWTTLVSLLFSLANVQRMFVDRSRIVVSFFSFLFFARERTVNREISTEKEVAT